MTTQFDADFVSPWARTRAFDYLVDFRNLPEWHSAVTRCELQTAEPQLRNARYRARASIAGRAVRAEITTVELERPDLIIAEAENAAAKTVDRFELESIEGGRGCRVAYHSEMTLKVALRAIGPLMVPGLTSSWESSLAGLQRVLEASAAATG